MDNAIHSFKFNNQEFKIAIPEIEQRLYNLENKIESRNEIYTTQYGFQTMAEAMKSVAEAAEKAMHGVCEAMARIYCLEDQLSGSSASAESENPNENLLGEFWSEIDKTNIFLQNLK